MTAMRNQQDRPASDPFQLGLVLKGAREYCRRLERAALDFTCVEQVTEKLDVSRDHRQNPERRAPETRNESVGSSSMGGHSSRMSVGGMSYDPRLPDKRDNIYLFDYQFIRREGKVEEKRVLLEANGKKAETKATLPQTQAFTYADILLGPVRLLDEKFAEYYVYRLAGKEQVGGKDAWILQVIPRLTGVTPYLGGRIFVACDDSSVLKIEWDPSTFGNFDAIVARAESYGAAPLVRSFTEFGFEKNGLRFPSADLTEEAYRLKNGKDFVRARTNVLYKDYKFFTVETETSFKK